MAATDTLAFNATEYWKGQDFLTSARLYLQHWIWSYQSCYTFHPTIPVTAERKLKIADVACGNGTWLLTASSIPSHAEHEYHGFDLTPAHFPAATWLPRTMKLHVWDAFSEVPEEHVGAFDVVHIRMISSAVVNNEVEPLVKNLLKMLKPGGYIQWDEQDASTLKATAPDGISSEALSTLVVTHGFLSEDRNKLLPDWLHNLGSTLRSHGCEVLADDQIEPRPELSRAWADYLLTVYKGIVHSVPEQPTPLPDIPGLPKELSRSVYTDLLMRGVQEAANGVWLSMVQRVIVARKASKRGEGC